MGNKLYQTMLKAARTGGNAANLADSVPSDSSGLSFYVRKVDIFTYDYIDKGPFKTYDGARKELERVAELTGNAITRNWKGEEVVLSGDSVLSVICEETGTI